VINLADFTAAATRLEEDAGDPGLARAAAWLRVVSRDSHNLRRVRMLGYSSAVFTWRRLSGAQRDALCRLATDPYAEIPVRTARSLRRLGLIGVDDAITLDGVALLAVLGTAPRRRQRS
jgi:hypothetical protein